MQLLNGLDWQFIGAAATGPLPEIDSDGFKSAFRAPVSVPHNFQTQMGVAYDTRTKGWYKRQVTVDPSAKGKELYLVLEGAASIAVVYVNGQHLGQLRGAYSWRREDEVAFKSTGALPPSDRPLPPLIKYGQG